MVESVSVVFGVAGRREMGDGRSRCSGGMGRWECGA